MERKGGKQRRRGVEGLEARVRARGRQPLASLLKKPSLRLQVIITAACYQEETSDLRSSAPLLLPLLPRLLGMKTKVQSQCVLFT